MARAKAKDIAALAGLAGLAYVNRDKLFGSKDKDEPKGKPDTGPGYNSTETRLKSPAESIAAADKSDKSTSISTKGPSGTTTPGPDKSVPNLNVEPAPVPKVNVDKKSDNKPKNRQKAEDENNALAAAGSKIPTVTSVPVKAKPQLAKPGTGVGASIATIANPVTQDDIEFRRLRDARMAKKINDMKVKTDAFKGAPMEDQIRQNMNSPNMRRGGAVKMASGGMTASRRGDGIASRGKTRGKIC